MSFNFPVNPTNGQIYSAPNGYQYVYRSDTDSWLGTAPVTDPSQSISGPPGSVGYTGSQGIAGYTGSAGNMVGANGNNIVNYPPDFVGPIPPNIFSSTEFLNINSTSRIVISVYNLKISDNAGLLLQFGTSSGYLIGPDLYSASSTTINGLTNAISTVGSDRGFVINLNSNSLYLNLTITLTRSGANNWVCTHHGTAVAGLGPLAGFSIDNFSNIIGGGSVNVGNAVIDRLRLICRSAVPGATTPGVINTGQTRILYDDAGAIPGDPSSGFVGYTGSAGNFGYTGSAGSGTLNTYFESSEISLAGVSSSVIPHNLNVVPKLVQLSLVCKTAEAGYTVGTEIYIMGYTDVPGQTSFSWSADNSAVYCRANGAFTFRVINRSTGGINSLNLANWRLIVRAFS